jgi:hypothetical protein
METGNIVTALVKEYTAEMPRKLAIYFCESYRISMKGSMFLFEIDESDDGVYNPIVTLKSKSAIASLISEKGREFDHRRYYPIILKYKEFDFIVIQNEIYLDEKYETRNKEKINNFVEILESES